MKHLQILLLALGVSISSGLKAMKQGKYKLHWLDCVTGKQVLQSQVTVAEGDQTWSKPAGIGDEVAVYIRRFEE